MGLRWSWAWGRMQVAVLYQALVGIISKNGKEVMEVIAISTGIDRSKRKLMETEEVREGKRR